MLGEPVDVDMSIPKGPSRFFPLGIGLLVILGCVAYLGVGVYSEAHGTAVRSYLMSVCSAVEEYRVQHGQYPSKLEQVKDSTLDYSVGIPLASLIYDLSDSELTISYSSKEGNTISCMRPVILLTRNDQKLRPHRGFNENASAMFQIDLFDAGRLQWLWTILRLDTKLDSSVLSYLRLGLNDTYRNCHHRSIAERFLTV
jgi:hypothetical protein